MLECPLLKRSIAYLQAVIPTAKRILVLFDDDITVQVSKKEIFGTRDGTVINSVVDDIRLLGTLNA